MNQVEATTMAGMSSYEETNQSPPAGISTMSIVAIATLWVGVAFLYFIAPKFQEMFMEMGIELPVITAFYLKMTNHIWMVIVPIAIFSIIMLTSLESRSDDKEDKVLPILVFITSFLFLATGILALLLPLISLMDSIE